MALKSQTRFFISATYGLRFLTAFVQLLQFLHILLVIVKLIFIHWKPWESRHSFGCSCHHRQSAGDESILYATVCCQEFFDILYSVYSVCCTCNVSDSYGTYCIIMRIQVPIFVLCGSGGGGG